MRIIQVLTPDSSVLTSLEAILLEMIFLDQSTELMNKTGFFEKLYASFTSQYINETIKNIRYSKYCTLKCSGQVRTEWKVVSILS